MRISTLLKCGLIVCCKNSLEPVLNVRGQPTVVLELSKVVKKKVYASFYIGLAVQCRSGIREEKVP
ncbi:MAG: hypothetical protein QW057_05120 [Candidatus Bathyarchaeia archaeon]